MSNADIRGRFIWHELMTTDPVAAGGFYSRVLPWRTQPSGMPSYTLWMAGKTQTGGLMALPPDSVPGTPPHWLVYIGTPSVDASVTDAQRLGGKVLKGATDIPNVGRYAVLSDPQGATFAVYTPAGAAAGGAGSGAAAGEFSWHELTTTDPQGALRFYSELCGWARGPGHDMGGTMGVYQIFTQGGTQVGGMYRVQDASTPAHWLGYVRVAEAARTAAAAKAAGGRVLHGPVEVPGGSWIVMLLDPQGGAFAVVEPPRVAAAKPPAVEPKQKPAAEPVKPAAAASQPSTSSTMPAAGSKLAAPTASKPAAPPASKPAAAAGKPAARKPAATKRKPARGKTAAKSASKKKRPAGKRAAAGRSTSAKRGKSAGKKRPAAKRSGTKKKARGKK